MKKNFDAIMEWLALYEGGFVNHPRDPGGATNRGVTQRVYDAWRDRNGVERRSVRFLTGPEHDAIYLRQYWLPVRGDELPSGLDATVFDFAVNSGVSRAVKTLQRALGVTADGIIGEVTLAAIQRTVRADNLFDLIIDINKRRMAFLRRLKTFSTFGKGWTRRVMGDHQGVQIGDIGVVDRSIMLARGDTPGAIQKPKAAAGGTARDSDLDWLGGLFEAIAAFVEALFQSRSKGGA